MPKFLKYSFPWLCCLVAIFITGCSDGKFPVRPVGGMVVCDGQAVTQGSITFTPVGEAETLETGKSATGAIATDGSFKLSTFGLFDGAIVGKHRVTFAGSEGEEEVESESGEDEKPARKSAQAKPNQEFVLPQDLIVEVKSSGENAFKIELTKKK